MAIEVVSAILVREVERLEDNYVRIKPVTAHLPVPASSLSAESRRASGL